MAALLYRVEWYCEDLDDYDHKVYSVKERALACYYGADNHSSAVTMYYSEDGGDTWLEYYPE